MKTLANLTPPIVSVTITAGPANSTVKVRGNFNANGSTIASKSWGYHYKIDSSSSSPSSYTTTQRTGQITSTKEDTYSFTSAGYTTSQYVHVRAFATNAGGTTYSSWINRKLT